MAQKTLQEVQQEKAIKDKADWLERYRQHVVEQELGAREAKGVYEKYHYTIEADKLVKEYDEVMKKNKELVDKHREDLKKFQEAAELNNKIIEQDSEIIKMAIAE